MPPDSVLVDSVRNGSLSDYGLLFRRHHPAALRFASALADAAAEDLVSEAFLRTFVLLRAGHGPTRSFRAYLFSAIRSAHANAARKDGRLCFDGDLHDTDLVTPGAAGTEESDVDAATAARAYRGLPLRWRQVLWLTAVEGRSHAEVAGLLGVKPESVRVLAFRAREGLRRAFIHEHLQPASSPACAEIVLELAAFARADLAPAKAAALETHVRRCGPCRERLHEAQDVGRSIAAGLAPRPRARARRQG